MPLIQACLFCTCSADIFFFLIHSLSETQLRFWQVCQPDGKSLHLNHLYIASRLISAPSAFKYWINSYGSHACGLLPRREWRKDKNKEKQNKVSCAREKMDISIYFSFLSSQFAKWLPRDCPRGNTALNTHSGICSLHLGFERDRKRDTTTTLKRIALQS